MLGLDGPKDPERCNDTSAAVVRTDPERFIGFASVNPAYRGVEAAVDELERAVTDLGLPGLKLYPMYQHWAANDPDIAFPIYAKAQELGIPVMIHQAGSTRIDAKLELGRPAHARRHRPRVPRPSCDHRPLRAPLGRRGAVPADQAPELLRGALLPDRHAHPPRPVPAAVTLRADVRPAGEALLRHGLPGLPLRPGRAAREADDGERGGGGLRICRRSPRTSSTGSWATTSRGSSAWVDARPAVSAGCRA